MAEIAPNASKHYLMAGIKDSSLTDDKYAQPLFMIRMNPGSFEDGNDIETETDEGHTGTSNVDMGSYRKTAESAPSWEDKLRYGEGLEDILYMLLPDHEVNTYNNGTGDVTGVYTHDYGLPANYEEELPVMTLYNGFNATNYDARAFNNQMANQIEFNFSADDAPTMKVTLIGDYNNFNLQNPSRVYLADYKRRFVQAPHTTVYVGAVGATAEQMLANPINCFTEANLTINHNVESLSCHGDEFGKNTKTIGTMEGTGSIVMPWLENTKYFETEFEGFDKYAHIVSEEIPNKQIWFRCRGGNIRRFSTSNTLLTGEILIGSTTVEETTTYEIATGIPYETILKIPEAEITKVTSPKSGTDAKDLTMEYKIIEQPTQSYMTASVISDLPALHIDNVGTTLTDLRPMVAPFATS